MPVDILDQPRVGILETLVRFLLQNGSTPYEDILDKLSGTNDGRDYLKRNALSLLQAIGFVSTEGDNVEVNDCSILVAEGDLFSRDFEVSFKTELLKRIASCQEPNVAYFNEVLRRLFDVEVFDNPRLEEILRQSRKKYGIQVSEGEELGGKIDFCITFLRELNLILTLEGIHRVYVDRDILRTIFASALKAFDQPRVKIYSELLELIDKDYLPVLNPEEGCILNSIFRVLSTPGFAESLNFSWVPDGGRPLVFGEDQYNVILRSE